MIPLIDGHLDLAWNALSWDRDQTLGVAQIREREAALLAGGAKQGRGRCTTTLPELKKAGVKVCLATILSRSRPGLAPRPDCLRTDLDHASQSIAHAAGMGQLAYYHLLEAQGLMRMIRDVETLDEVWANPDPAAPLGYVLSMEGSDPIVDPAQAKLWWDLGLRVASLAHYGQSAYAFGTGGDGPLTPRGRDLLREFARLGIILDLTHTAHTAFFQALDLFPGPLLASHNNCQSLVPGDRQFTDAQVRAIVARGGVIGAALDAWMLVPGWKIGSSSPRDASLAQVADHIERVCQLAGSAKHAAIGSDLDGGFGTEQTPCDLETIADLQKLDGILEKRGFPSLDRAAIFHGNWISLLRRALPRRAQLVCTKDGMIAASTGPRPEPIHAESQR